MAYSGVDSSISFVGIKKNRLVKRYAILLMIWNESWSHFCNVECTFLSIYFGIMAFEITFLERSKFHTYVKLAN